MILSMSGQAIIFLTTVAAGFFSGFIFDCFRVFRKTFPHKNFFVLLEDIIYWLLACAVIFYSTLRANDGEIRFYLIIGAMTGMVLYFCTLSLVFLPLSVAIVEFIKKTVRFIIMVLLAPFRLVLYLLGFPYRIVKKALNKVTNRTFVGLRKTRNYARIRLRKVKSELNIIRKKK